jgi:stress response protein YsnF
MGHRAGISSPPSSIERARRGSEPGNFQSGKTSGESIPIVKEKLEVGKQQTEERVHVRVEPVERPVEKTVDLRDERVVVERRPPGAHTHTSTDRDLAPREFDVVERHEKPVATKRSDVTEAVVVRRDVTEHAETVRDTVKETKVGIDKPGRPRRPV